MDSAKVLLKVYSDYESERNVMGHISLGSMRGFMVRKKENEKNLVSFVSILVRHSVSAPETL